ncbi:hypothetical protein HMPREF1352_03139 [Enterococcus faecium 511]|nr:hypothetical protein HMPREF1352_03139 [Enterococcus faecium 511]EPI17495.1 hypothetical protein D353_02683 [Enterococcus faecium OC2A-1]EPI19584.1 hypothetical protein D352_02767 [Enterococcus faecium LA4B-2]
MIGCSYYLMQGSFFTISFNTHRCKRFILVFYEKANLIPSRSLT